MTRNIVAAAGLLGALAAAGAPPRAEAAGTLAVPSVLRGTGVEPVQYYPRHHRDWRWHHHHHRHHFFPRFRHGDDRRY